MKNLMFVLSLFLTLFVGCVAPSEEPTPEEIIEQLMAEKNELKREYNEVNLERIVAAGELKLAVKELEICALGDSISQMKLDSMARNINNLAQVKFKSLRDEKVDSLVQAELNKLIEKHKKEGSYYGLKFGLLGYEHYIALAVFYTPQHIDTVYVGSEDEIDYDIQDGTFEYWDENDKKRTLLETNAVVKILEIK